MGKAMLYVQSKCIVLIISGIFSMFSINKILNVDVDIYIYSKILERNVL